MTAGGGTHLPRDRITSRALGGGGDDRIAVGGDRQRNQAGQRAPFEDDSAGVAPPDDMMIFERAWRADTELPVPKLTLETDREARFARTAVLDGDRIDQARRVGVAAVRGKDRGANHHVPDRRRERGNPARHALPRERPLTERNRFATHL